MHGGVPFFLWHGARLSYKHIKIWGEIVYIINGRVTINNLDDRSHCGYLTGYAATTVVILYWKPYQPSNKIRNLFNRNLNSRNLY